MSSLYEKVKKTLPDTPGVYFFKAGDKVLYVGKATSLRDRVKSYFVKDISSVRSPLIARMVQESDEVLFEETGSVLEAFILEASLIKRYTPIYNTKDKDGKSFNYVVITKEEYPRVFTLRGNELQAEHEPEDFLHVFGPYTSGSSLKEALKIVRKIFPFRGEKDKIGSKRYSKIHEELGLLPRLGDEVGREEYMRTISHIALFFQGKKKKILTQLKKEMKEYAKEMEFEKANLLKRKIFALEHIQDIALLKSDREEGGDMRIEAYDIAHTSGKDMVGVMTVLVGGFQEKSEYRKFLIKTVEGANDTKALQEVLRRRFTHDEWRLPALIVMDGGKAQYEVCKRVLEEFGYQIPVVSVVKDDSHRPKGFLGPSLFRKKYEKEILLANSEAHRFALSFHRKKRSAF